MSEDVAVGLRSLANDYSHGRVDFAAYRRSRTALLDSLIAVAPVGSQLEAATATPSAAPSAAPLASMPSPLAPTSSPSASNPPPLASTRPRLVATPSDASPPAVSAGRIRSPWRPSRAHWIGAVALLSLALLLGALMFHHSDTGAPRDARASTTSPDRIFDLISPLMSDPDWSDAHVAAVNAALLEEGSRQIALRQQTAWFQRFATEVRRRLGEQRALGADHLAPAKNSLAALAVTIGLDPGAPELPLRPPIAGSSAADSGK